MEALLKLSDSLLKLLFKLSFLLLLGELFIGGRHGGRAEKHLLDASGSAFGRGLGRGEGDGEGGGGVFVVGGRVFVGFGCTLGSVSLYQDAPNVLIVSV